MKSIDTPDRLDNYIFDLNSTYQEICNCRSNGNFKVFLNKSLHTWKVLCDEYHIQMTRKGFVSVSQKKAWIKFKNEMEGLYKNAKFNNERSYIPHIRNSYRYDTCPYCLLPDSSNLDHYYSKMLFPQYALYPNNLIPSCDSCNKIKDEIISKGRGEKILNPYYDTFLDQILLRLIFTFDQGVIKIDFEPLDHLLPIQKKMVRFHVVELDIIERSKTIVLSEYKRYLKFYNDMPASLSKKQKKDLLIILFRSGGVHTWSTITLNSILCSTQAFNAFLTHVNLFPQ